VPGQEQVIEATILGIEPEGNGGWVKVNTDQGPFTTKFAEGIAEAQAHVNQRVQITYQLGEARAKADGSGWYPTPRYFKRVSAPGYSQPQQPPPFAGQPQQQLPAQPVAQPQLPPAQPAGPDERSMQIMRQAAGKLAVWTMPLVPSEHRTFKNQLGIAEAGMRYFVGGLQATGVSLGPSTPDAPPLTQEQQMQQAVYGVDPTDDIPF
jgi:hypothetical protein